MTSTANSSWPLEADAAVVKAEEAEEAEAAGGVALGVAEADDAPYRAAASNAMLPCYICQRKSRR